jgi:hypothetical protein
MAQSGVLWCDFSPSVTASGQVPGICYQVAVNCGKMLVFDNEVQGNRLLAENGGK